MNERFRQEPLIQHPTPPAANAAPARNAVLDTVNARLSMLAEFYREGIKQRLSQGQNTRYVLTEESCIAVFDEARAAMLAHAKLVEPLIGELITLSIAQQEARANLLAPALVPLKLRGASGEAFIDVSDGTVGWVKEMTHEQRARLVQAVSAAVAEITRAPMGDPLHSDAP